MFDVFCVLVFVAAFQLLSSYPFYSPRVVQSVVVFLHSGLLRYSKETKEIGSFASTVATNPDEGRADYTASDAIAIVKW